MPTRDRILLLGELGASIRTQFANDERALFESGHEAFDSEALTCVRILIVRSGVRVDASLLRRMPRLTCVIRAGSGIDNLDTEVLATSGVDLVRLPAASAAAVAELGLSALTLLVRQQPLGQALLSKGHWAKGTLVGDDLSALDVGIWGSGAIGQCFHAIVSPLCRGVVHAEWPSTPRRFARASAEELADRADVHVVCLPLRPDTVQMFNARFFCAARPRRPYFVNLSRFEAVAWDAAVEALQSDGLRGLFVDPIDRTHLDKACALLNRAAPSNVLLAPHIGAQRRDVMEAIASGVVAEVERRWPSIAARE